MTYDKPSIPPFEFTLEFLKQLEQESGSLLSDLVDRSFSHWLIDLHPGITIIKPKDAASTYYVVDPELAGHLAVHAHGGGVHTEVILHICAANVWNGQPVPKAFRASCTSILRGESVWPVKRGRKPGDRFGLFWLATSTAKMIHDAYGIDIARGSGGAPSSASDIVAEALTEMDVECSYLNVRDWCQHGKNKAKRAGAELISRLLTEYTLMEMGVLKTRTNWILGIPTEYAPIVRKRRMTDR